MSWTCPPYHDTVQRFTCQAPLQRMNTALGDRRATRSLSWIAVRDQLVARHGFDAAECDGVGVSATLDEMTQAEAVPRPVLTGFSSRSHDDQYRKIQVGTLPLLLLAVRRRWLILTRSSYVWLEGESTQSNTT